jgi:DNA-binding transcriptional regulator YdaS (Cro superfamily)
MSSFPIGMIRQRVREAINTRPGFGKTEAVVVQAVNVLLGGGVSLQEVRDAIEWNHSERFIRSERDEENEVTVWKITPEGQAKESIR